MERPGGPERGLLPGEEASSQGRKLPACINIIFTTWGTSLGAGKKKNLVKNLPSVQETPVQILGCEDLLEKG